MKGINKHVVEIVEPQNEYIERVIVFLRQDQADDVRIAAGRKEAESYVQNLVCWRRRFWPAGLQAKRVILFGAVGAVVAAAVLLLLFL